VIKTEQRKKCSESSEEQRQPDEHQEKASLQWARTRSRAVLGFAEAMPIRGHAGEGVYL